MKSVLPKSLATQVPVSPFNGSKCNTSIAHLMSITEINVDCNFIDAKWRRSIFHFDSAVKSPELLQKRGVVETPRATRSPDQLCTSGLPFKLTHLVQLLNFPWNCSAQNPMILGTPNPSASLCRNSLNSSHSCGFEVCVSIFMGSCIHVHSHVFTLECCNMLQFHFKTASLLFYMTKTTPRWFNLFHMSSQNHVPPNLQNLEYPWFFQGGNSLSSSPVGVVHSSCPVLVANSVVPKPHSCCGVEAPKDRRSATSPVCIKSG